MEHHRDRRGRGGACGIMAVLLLCLVLGPAAHAERGASANFRLQKAGLLGGHTFPATPVASVNYRVTAGVLGAISGPTTSSPLFACAPGYLQTAFALGRARIVAFSVSDGVALLVFDPVAAAAGYQVRETEDLGEGFSVNTVGVFDGNAWRAPSSA